MTDRTATTIWTGELSTGSGRVRMETSGAGEFDVSWLSRTEEANGKTSPEELIAAAHSSCYCIQLSHLLAAGGTPPERIETTATVSFGPRGDGFAITGVALAVRARVPGADEGTFAKAAEQAKLTCPVSAAFTGAPVTLDATLSE